MFYNLCYNQNVPGDGRQECSGSVPGCVGILVLTDKLLEIFEELFFWCVILNERDDHFDDAYELIVGHSILHVINSFPAIP